MCLSLSRLQFINSCVRTKSPPSRGSGAAASASIVKETEDEDAEQVAVPLPNPISTSSFDLFLAQNLNTVRM